MSGILAIGAHDVFTRGRTATHFRSRSMHQHHDHTHYQIQLQHQQQQEALGFHVVHAPSAQGHPLDTLHYGYHVDELHMYGYSTSTSQTQAHLLGRTAHAMQKDRVVEGMLQDPQWRTGFVPRDYSAQHRNIDIPAHRLDVQVPTTRNDAMQYSNQQSRTPHASTQELHNGRALSKLIDPNVSHSVAGLAKFQRTQQFSEHPHAAGLQNTRRQLYSHSCPEQHYGERNHVRRHEQDWHRAAQRRKSVSRRSRLPNDPLRTELDAQPLTEVVQRHDQPSNTAQDRVPESVVQGKYPARSTLENFREGQQPSAAHHESVSSVGHRHCQEYKRRGGSRGQSRAEYVVERQPLYRPCDAVDDREVAELQPSDSGLERYRSRSQILLQHDRTPEVDLHAPQAVDHDFQRQSTLQMAYSDSTDNRIEPAETSDKLSKEISKGVASSSALGHSSNVQTHHAVKPQYAQEIGDPVNNSYRIVADKRALDPSWEQQPDHASNELRNQPVILTEEGTDNFHHPFEGMRSTNTPSANLGCDKEVAENPETTTGNLRSGGDFNTAASTEVVDGNPGASPGQRDNSVKDIDTGRDPIECAQSSVDELDIALTRVAFRALGSRDAEKLRRLANSIPPEEISSRVRAAADIFAYTVMVALDSTAGLPKSKDREETTETSREGSSRRFSFLLQKAKERHDHEKSSELSGFVAKRRLTDLSVKQSSSRRHSFVDGGRGKELGERENRMARRSTSSLLKRGFGRQSSRRSASGNMSTLHRSEEAELELNDGSNMECRFNPPSPQPARDLDEAIHNTIGELSQVATAFADLASSHRVAVAAVCLDAIRDIVEPITNIEKRFCRGIGNAVARTQAVADRIERLAVAKCRQSSIPKSNDDSISALRVLASTTTALTDHVGVVAREGLFELRHAVEILATRANRGSFPAVIASANPHRAISGQHLLLQKDDKKYRPAAMLNKLDCRAAELALVIAAYHDSVLAAVETTHRSVQRVPKAGSIETLHSESSEEKHRKKSRRRRKDDK